MSHTPNSSARLNKPARRQYSIQIRSIGWLLWLRWKLTIHAYTRSASHTASFGIMVVFVLPFALALAIATSVGYNSLPRPEAVELLFVVLVALYLLYALLPLLQFNLNEGLDVTRLQLYPLTQGEKMIGLALATLLDISTLAVFFLYGAIIVGWHSTIWANLITIAGLALASIHIITMSQIVLTIFTRALRSRRYRDLAIILAALVSTSGYLIGQMVSHWLKLTSPTALAQLPLDRYLQWTPPGMVARAIALADQASYVSALAWLLGAGALVPILLCIWAWVLERGITSAETASSPSSRSRRRQPETAPLSETTDTVSTGTRSSRDATALRYLQQALTVCIRQVRLSPPVLAIARKDARYFWRDPHLKALMVRLLSIVAIFIAWPYLSNTANARAGFSIPSFALVLAAPLAVLFMLLYFGYNALGLEQQELQVVLLFPVRPREILWGKNLATGALALGVQTALTLGMAAITARWLYVLPALSAGLAALLVMLGCGNVTSVLFPFPMGQMRLGKGNAASGNGCMQAVILLAAASMTTVLLAPVAAAELIPLLLGQWLWLVLSLPLAVLYGIALHQLATRLIAPRLLSRAPEILEVLAQES